jgi:hypothetical protein
MMTLVVCGGSLARISSRSCSVTVSMLVTVSLEVPRDGGARVVAEVSSSNRRKNLVRWFVIEKPHVVKAHGCEENKGSRFVESAKTRLDWRLTVSLEVPNTRHAFVIA